MFVFIHGYENDMLHYSNTVGSELTFFYLYKYMTIMLHYNNTVVS